ncbi:MAG: IS630 family transposase [Rubrobacteraceae bacterium]
MRAAEQDRPDVAASRRFWIKTQRLLEPQSLVFLDESGAKTNMTTLYGRSEVGERCVDASPHGHWKTLTLLSAIRLDGVIEDATIVVDGAMDGEVFANDAERCLAPSLRPGDLVVMDNLPSHKVTGVAEAIETAHANVWYLPAYSPDLNPIEKLWSKVKAWLRRVAADTIDGLIEATADALRDVQPDECKHYFESCGYGQ